MDDSNSQHAAHTDLIDKVVRVTAALMFVIATAVSVLFALADAVG